MGAGATAKRRRTGTENSANSATPSRSKPSATGRGRGRPPNAPRDGRERPPALAECFRKRCSDMLDRLSKKDHYNIFLEPVNVDDVAGYAETIKRPMDFTTMRTKLAQGVYKSLGEFRKDLDLIWSNCLLFNGEEPTNVFSKKAIELSRLTEKLIVTTRQNLEKDKENVLKWKEKHRRRKEAMQANAANAAAGPVLHGASIGTPPVMHANRDPRSSTPAPAARTPINNSPSELDEEPNGRTPEQNALAESLRLQYAGTSGLYKKSVRNAALPQYTKPDGSIVQIPLVRYSPENDNWDTYRSEYLDPVMSETPDFLCRSLPPKRKRRRCRPEPNRQSILVEDYMNSLHDFVKQAGPVSMRIVNELLSPELAVKKQQEELRKRGLDVRSCPSKPKLPHAVRVPAAKLKWDADSIVKLANDIEIVNKRDVSILPKLHRSIKELDGINGLRQLVGEGIAREVDEVPVQVVDYAMPHGASLSTIQEICDIQKSTGIQLPENDLRHIEDLRKTAQDFLSRIGPEARPRMTAASVVPAAHLHATQLRALAMRRNRRIEAEKQVTFIAQQAQKVEAKLSEVPVTQQRALGLNAQAMERERAAVVRAPPIIANAQRVAYDQAAAIEAKSQVALELMKGSGAVPVSAQSVGNLSHTSARAVTPQNDHGMNSLPPATKDSVCKVCGAKDTLGWQGGAVDGSGVERLCNQCGAPWEKTNSHRPGEIWGHSAQRKPRSASGSPAPNSISERVGGANVSVTPNGITGRAVQNTSRSSPSGSRRSPMSVGSDGSKSRIPPNMMMPNQMALGGHRITNAGISSNGYETANLHPNAPQMQLATQAFPSQGDARSSIETNNFLAQQAVHSAHFSNPMPFTGTAGVGTAQLNVQPTAPVGTMNTDQGVPAAGVTQAANTASTFIPAHKEAYAGKAQTQETIGNANALNTSFSLQVVDQKNRNLASNGNGGGLQQKFAGHTQLMSKATVVGNKPNGGLMGDQRQVMIGDHGMMGGNLGGAGMQNFMNHANANSSLVSGFGDEDTRSAFTGGTVENSEGVGVGTEQIVENIFFDESGLDRSPVPPEFDF